MYKVGGRAVPPASFWKALGASYCGTWDMYVGKEACRQCDQENSSVHLLFVCPLFSALGSDVVCATGQAFSVDTLSTPVRREQLLIAKFGRDLFHTISSMCR
jgi:hypothetical protein